ncbi:MAG: prepilin-type N-terminal cleavage/methylation domain-containing protein [Xanthomonadales bacterium]
MFEQPARFAQKGFSLVEVAVAAAICSLGLGSMSLLLVLAVHGTHTPRAETLAALQARSLADALRLVPDGAVAPAGEANTCAPTVDCPPAAMAGSIMESWQARIVRDLPTGRGLVCRDSAPDTEPCADATPGAITVRWRDTEPDSGTETTGEFVLALPAP